MHVVYSETEGFIGQIWTIQCEIISQTMLAGQPLDEDIPPMDDPFKQREPPFDFFALGQKANHLMHHLEASNQFSQAPFGRSGHHHDANFSYGYCFRIGFGQRIGCCYVSGLINISTPFVFATWRQLII
jgi:hypothetical protein